jgi:hypothetical protein
MKNKHFEKLIVSQLTKGSDRYHGYDMVRESEAESLDMAENSDLQSEIDFHRVVGIENKVHKYILETTFFVDNVLNDSFSEEKPQWVIPMLHGCISEHRLDYSFIAEELDSYFLSLTEEQELEYKNSRAA